MGLKQIARITMLLIFSPIAVSANDSNLVQQEYFHFGIWVASGIILTAVLISWLLNHAVPKVRALGTLLAATACFSIVIWFVGILGTGILENPKPNQTPMDSAKPMLLWIQVSLAMVAGLVLLMTSYRQSRSSEVLNLPAKNEPERYGFVSRMVHWITAILFLSLIPMGIFTSMIPEGTWFRNEYYVTHKTIGVTIFGLLLFRIFWNRLSKRPVLDAALKPFERRWAHRVHIALYVLLIAMPLTGYVMTSFHGFPTFFFGLELQPLWEKSQAYIIWGTFHKYILQYLIYIILGAHIVGALKHHYIDKKRSAFKRMVS